MKKMTLFTIILLTLLVASTAFASEDLNSRLKGQISLVQKINQALQESAQRTEMLKNQALMTNGRIQMLQDLIASEEKIKESADEPEHIVQVTKVEPEQSDDEASIQDQKE